MRLVRSNFRQRSSRAGEIPCGVVLQTRSLARRSVRLLRWCFLVVITIIGILIALLLPAVRRPARRPAWCSAGATSSSSPWAA